MRLSVLQAGNGKTWSGTQISTELWMRKVSESSSGGVSCSHPLCPWWHHHGGFFHDAIQHQGTDIPCVAVGTVHWRREKGSGSGGALLLLALAEVWGLWGGQPQRQRFPCCWGQPRVFS